MADDTRLHPVALMRDLALVLQRFAAEAAQRPDYAPGERVRLATSSAMRGAAEELSASLPRSLDPALVAMLADAGRVLARLTHEAASRPKYRPGQRVEIATQAALRGFVHAFRDSMPKVSSTYGLVLSRLTELLERSADAAEERAESYRSPGERGGELAAGVVRGAVLELGASLPHLEEAVRAMLPLVGDLAGKTGEGLSRGLGAHADEAVLTAEVLVDRAARTLVHALADQLSEEWRRRPISEAPLRQALAEAGEAVASGVARGVGEGALDAMGALGRRLWRPAVAAVALVGTGALAVGWGLRALRKA